MRILAAVLGCTLTLLAFLSWAESTPSISLNPISEDFNSAQTRQRRNAFDFIVDSAANIAKSVADIAVTVVGTALALIAGFLKAIGVVVFGFASALLSLPGGLPEGVVIPDTTALQNGEIKDPNEAILIITALIKASNMIIVKGNSDQKDYLLDKMTIYLPKINDELKKMLEPSDLEELCKVLSLKSFRDLLVEYNDMKINLQTLKSTSKTLLLISLVEETGEIITKIISYIEIYTISFKNDNSEVDDTTAHVDTTESAFDEELDGVIEESVTSTHTPSLSETDTEESVAIELDLNTNEIDDEHIADKDLHLDFETEDVYVNIDEQKEISGHESAVISIDDYILLLTKFLSLVSGNEKEISAVLAGAIVSTEHGYHASLAVLLDNISEISALFEGVNKEKLLSLQVSLKQLQVELLKHKLSDVVTALLQKITVAVNVVTSVLKLVENLNVAALELSLNAFVIAIETGTPAQREAILRGENIDAPGGLKVSLIFILENISKIHLNTENITRERLVALMTLLKQLRVLLTKYESVPASHVETLGKKIYESLITLDMVLRTREQLELNNLTKFLFNIVFIIKSGDAPAIKNIITGGLLPELGGGNIKLSLLDALNRLAVILGTNQDLPLSKILRLKYASLDLKVALLDLKTTEFAQSRILLEKLLLIQDLVRKPIELSEIFNPDVTTEFLKIFNKILTSGNIAQINEVLSGKDFTGPNNLKISLQSLLDIVFTFNLEMKYTSTTTLVIMQSVLSDLHDVLRERAQTVETVNIISKLSFALHLVSELIAHFDLLSVEFYKDYIIMILTALKGASPTRINEIITGDRFVGSHGISLSVFTLMDKLVDLKVTLGGISLDGLDQLKEAMLKLKTELNKLPKTNSKAVEILNTIDVALTVNINMHTEIKAINIVVINQFLSLMVNANAETIKIIISGGKITGANGKQLSLIEILNLISGLKHSSEGVNKAAIATLLKGLHSIYDLLYKLPKTHPLLNYLLRRLTITIYAVRTIAVYEARLGLEALAPVVTSFIRIINRAPADRKDAIIARGVIKLAGGVQISFRHIVEYILLRRSSDRGLTIRKLVNMREKFVRMRRLLWRIKRTWVVTRALRRIAKVLNHLDLLAREVRTLNLLQLLRAINNLLKNGTSNQKHAIVNGRVVSTPYLRGSLQATLAAMRRQPSLLRFRWLQYRHLLTRQKNELIKSKNYLKNLSFAPAALIKNVVNTYGLLNAYFLQRA